MKILICRLMLVVAIFGLFPVSCSLAEPQTASTPSITPPFASNIYPATTTLTSGNSSTTNEAPPEIADQVLVLLLKSLEKDGIYTVVSPDTSLGLFLPEDTAASQDIKNGIVEHFNKGYYDYTNLAGVLCELNLKSEKLTLNSSPENGYYIDYEQKFSQYFQTGGGGWERWRQENPQAHGYTTVSIPAYDPQTGYVLVYIGRQFGWLAGAGYIYSYKYTDGTLIQLDSYMLWIS